jgi:hypothetical protein
MDRAGLHNSQRSGTGGAPFPAPVADISLDSTDVSDKSIETLKSMGGLKSLNLYHTLVTEKGMHDLAAALPTCKIVFDRDSACPIEELWVKTDASDRGDSSSLSRGLLWRSDELNTDWIESLGGSVTKDAHGVVTGVNLRGSWVTDTDLRKLAEYPAADHARSVVDSYHGRRMAELKNLRNVTDLNLYYAEYVTDQGVAAIKDWKKLKRLNLHGTKCSDTALEHIAGITSLESLDVGSTLMTDVGLERLTTLSNLKELTMGGNELGDAGLQALRQLPTLTYLDLSGRQGTDKNVWTIVMSTAGLDAVLSLHNLRELRIGCYAMNVGIEEKKFAEVSATAVLPEWLDRMRAPVAEPGDCEISGLWKDRRRVDQDSQRHAQPQGGRPSRHRRHRKRRRRPAQPRSRA